MITIMIGSKESYKDAFSQSYLRIAFKLKLSAGALERKGLLRRWMDR